MTCSCCEPSLETTERATCPVDGSNGVLVNRLTVAAQMRDPVPPKQEFWMCRSPDCMVVYFGSAGKIVTLDQVHEIPGFKASGRGLVCYCFGILGSEIVEEVRTTGTSRTGDSVEEQVRAGNCFCEVKNPSGKCCLRDLEALVGEIQQTRQE